MKVEFTAGKFRIESWTHSWPMWSEIFYEDKKIHGIHHRDLKDLAYIVDRMRSAMRQHLGSSAHELD